jgi:hypothetical protein
LLAALLWLVPTGAHAQAIEAWVQLFGTSPDLWPGPGLALDASGNVVVSGAYREVSSSPLDWLTIRYSSAGVLLWTNRYDGPDTAWAWDQPGNIAVDASGVVYVTGKSFNGASFDYAAIAYSSNGIPLWTNYYNGPANGNDFALAIAVDTNGNVYVTGQSENSVNYDIPTIRYSRASPNGAKPCGTGLGLTWV